LIEVFLKFIIKKYSAKIYFEGNPEICEMLGFREIQKKPNFFSKKSRVFLGEKKNLTDPSFVARPNLIVLDGGKGQLSTVLKKVKFPKNVEVIGLAKKYEEIFRRDKDGKFEKIILSRDSSALLLLQRMRDEAHRFANILREKQASWKK
jgi:excinuclease ABC subunit C